MTYFYVGHHDTDMVVISRENWTKVYDMTRVF